jgi:hypothetical protein
LILFNFYKNLKYAAGNPAVHLSKNTMGPNTTTVQTKSKEITWADSLRVTTITDPKAKQINLRGVN